MQDKFIELETKFSFQEDLLTSLNDEVARQQRQIGELLREMAMIKRQLAEWVERDHKQVSGDDVQEIPPHY